MDFRAKEKKRLDDNPELKIGDVTTVNLTQVYVSIYYDPNRCSRNKQFVFSSCLYERPVSTIRAVSVILSRN